MDEQIKPIHPAQIEYVLGDSKYLVRVVLDIENGYTIWIEEKGTDRLNEDILGNELIHVKKHIKESNDVYNSYPIELKRNVIEAYIVDFISDAPYIKNMDIISSDCFSRVVTFDMIRAS